MCDKLKSKVLSVIQRHLNGSHNPHYQRVGTSSIIVYLSDYQDYFNPLINVVIEEKDKEKKITLLIKKDTDGFSLDKPYKRKDYDFEDSLIVPSPALEWKIYSILSKRIDIF